MVNKQSYVFNLEVKVKDKTSSSKLAYFDGNSPMVVCTEFYGTRGDLIQMYKMNLKKFHGLEIHTKSKT